MNIKRIILEEIDDFDWIKDIEPLGIDVTLGNAFIGMKVRISPESEYYGDEDWTNPKDVNGKIYKIENEEHDDNLGHIFHVDWGNNFTNNYRVGDLITI